MVPANVRSSRVLTASVWFAGITLVTYLIHGVAAGGSGSRAQVLSDLARIPVTLLTAALGLRLVLRRDLVGAERRSWIWLEMAFLINATAHAASLILSFNPGWQTFPTFVDYLYAAATPVLVAGVMLVPAAVRSRSERMKLLVDSLIVVASACMALWYLEIAPLLQVPGADVEVIAFTAAVPVLDLLLLFALVTLLLRRPDFGRVLSFLGASVLLKVVADTTYVMAIVQFGVVFAPDSWIFLPWAAADFLALLAVHQRLKQEDRPRDERGKEHTFTWLPYGATGLAYAMLVFVGRNESLYALGGMIVGAILLTSLVIARQMIAQRESHQLAVTDPLTGLSNRAEINRRVAEMTRQLRGRGAAKPFS